VVLGLLLVLPDLLEAAGPLRVAAVASALGASSWRWGTTSLEALAGAQAVLGPAGGVGPAWAAAGSWLAAGALLLALGRGPEPLRGLAVGAAVAAVLAGPAPGGQIPVRIAVGVGGAVAALALAHLRSGRARLDGALLALGLVAAAGAVGSVAASDPDGSPHLPAGLVGQGLLIGVAVGAAVAVLSQIGPRWRRSRGAPTVERRPPGPASQAVARPLP
jgi:hypothetical protein